MAGYTRQSAAQIVSGEVISASPLNAELNQVLAAFNNSTGHSHDGTAAEGPPVDRIADADQRNKILIDTANDHIEFYTEVSSAAAQQLHIRTGSIRPETTNTIDLGHASKEFKDLYIDGIAHIDVLDVDASATIATTLEVTGAITGSSTVQGTTITATTAFVPNASDGAALGTTALEFSDLYLADGAVIALGADQDVTLTHVHDTGLLLNSTNKIQFNDASQFIHGSSNAILSLGATDTISLTATDTTISGTLTPTGKIIADAGIDIDNFNIDGTTIALSSGDMTVDVAGDINLDAGGADIVLKDDGTQYGAFTNTSGNLIVKSGTTTAATFDGANVTFAGTVNPASHLDMPDSAIVKLGTGDDLQIQHDGTNSFIANSTGTLKIATESSGIPVVIGHGTSEVTIGDNLTVAGNLTVSGTQTVVNTVTMNAENAIVFEGATPDDHETTLTIVDPTADRTINLPNQSGTVPLLAAASNDQVTATPTELSLLDGGTSVGTGAIADGDGLIIDDAGTMRKATVQTLAAYLDDEITAMPNLITTAATTVGALDSGSITSNFGAINNGASNISTTGTVSFGNLSDGTVTITDIADEDNFSSNSATKLATQQSIKAYVDANREVEGVSATGSEINTTSDGGTTVGTTAVSGGDGIVTNDATVMRQTSVDTFDTYLSGTTKALTNKTLTAPKIVDGGFIADANGNEALVFQTTTSAVNAVEITNSSANAAVVLGVTGSDTNIDIDITPKGSGEVNIAAGNLNYASTAITSTGAELNILDGVTSTATELNILDGVTSTTAELNILDGVTSTATELNILDGVTSTAAELNYNDITALGTSQASKVVTADANGVVTFDNGKIEESTAVSSSSNAATINLRDGDNFTHTLSENVTYTFSNPAASGKVSAFTLKVTQDSTGRAITWPSSVDWAAATAPTITTTNAGVDVFAFFTSDGGTTYYGFTAGQAMG